MAFQGFSLAGKTALVTGSARGIGRGIALGLAQAGASVAVLDRPEMAGPARAVRDEIQALGSSVRIYELDVTHTAEIGPTVDRIVHDFGALDILVNCAGTGVNLTVFEVTEEAWDRNVALNLKASFFFAQAAARHMAARKSGRIINVASTHALIAVPYGAPYVASKGGIVSMTRSLAMELVSHGINVNAIAPGPVNTPLMRQYDAEAGRTAEDIRRDMQNRVPLGRRLEIDELVGAVIYLASPAASATVGHVLVVDGGQTIQ